MDIVAMLRLLYIIHTWHTHIGTLVLILSLPTTFLHPKHSQKSQKFGPMPVKDVGAGQLPNFFTGFIRLRHRKGSTRLYLCKTYGIGR